MEDALCEKPGLRLVLAKRQKLTGRVKNRDASVTDQARRCRLSADEWFGRKTECGRRQ